MQVRQSMSGAAWYSADGRHWYASPQAAASAVLGELRTALTAAGVTADSPAVLGAEGELLARQERWS